MGEWGIAYGARAARVNGARATGCCDVWGVVYMVSSCGAWNAEAR